MTLKEEKTAVTNIFPISERIKQGHANDARRDCKPSLEDYDKKYSKKIKCIFDTKGYMD